MSLFSQKGDHSLEMGTRRNGVVLTSIKFFGEQSLDEIPKHEKGEREISLINEAIMKNEFLSKALNEKVLGQIIDAMYSRDVIAGEKIIKQFTIGSHMYVSENGCFEVSARDEGVVHIFEDVRVFGDLAIIYDARRNATITATTPGKIWVLDRTVYQKLIIRNNVEEEQNRLGFLEKVNKLSGYENKVLKKVADLLKVESFSSGTEIVTQGDKGDKFYIIREGTASVSKKGEGVIAKLGKGDSFGEIALLKEKTRQATVTATSRVECLTLHEKKFIKFFGKMKSGYIPTLPELRKISEIRPQFSDIRLTDFVNISTLGVGGFGRVDLVQHKDNSELVFVLKYLKKIDIVAQNHQERLCNEKDIQISCNSKFIVRLYRTFKNKRYVFFLMESCMGGDVFTLMHTQKLRKFKEKQAKFITGCTIGALEYLHKRGIFHGDLKPENLVIDSSGYVKLTDFGFSKNLGDSGKSFSFAGTPDYVAPEILLNKGHDKAADYWALGVLIYEFLSGKTPFYVKDASHMKTFNRILAGIDVVDFPSSIPENAARLTRKLCRSVPSERLGYQRDGIEDVKKHKWFAEFDWNKLYSQTMNPPFVPVLKSNIDSKYFPCTFKQDDGDAPEETSDWDKDF